MSTSGYTSSSAASPSSSACWRSAIFPPTLPLFPLFPFGPEAANFLGAPLPAPLPAPACLPAFFRASFPPPLCVPELEADGKNTPIPSSESESCSLSCFPVPPPAPTCLLRSPTGGGIFFSPALLLLLPCCGLLLLLALLFLNPPVDEFAVVATFFLLFDNPSATARSCPSSSASSSLSTPDRLAAPCRPSSPPCRPRSSVAPSSDGTSCSTSSLLSLYSAASSISLSPRAKDQMQLKENPFDSFSLSFSS
ncbi:MAG: hypothetical protein Q8P67_08870 [archaeon]|nr:hypothetical protein [archaeon]